eukprot:scaffold10602_cov115-Isochrysis_galbana.AAC.2
MNKRARRGQAGWQRRGAPPHPPSWQRGWWASRTNERCVLDRWTPAPLCPAFSVRTCHTTASRRLSQFARPRREHGRSGISHSLLPTPGAGICRGAAASGAGSAAFAASPGHVRHRPQRGRLPLALVLLGPAPRAECRGHFDGGLARLRRKRWWLGDDCVHVCAGPHPRRGADPAASTHSTGRPHARLSQRCSARHEHAQDSDHQGIAAVPAVPAVQPGLQRAPHGLPCPGAQHSTRLGLGASHPTLGIRNDSWLAGVRAAHCPNRQVALACPDPVKPRGFPQNQRVHSKEDRAHLSSAVHLLSLPFLVAEASVLTPSFHPSAFPILCIGERHLPHLLSTRRHPPQQGVRPVAS